MLRDNSEIQWVIVGDGRMREWAQAEVNRRGLENNFHFLGRYPLDTMPYFFEAADAMLVTLKKEPIFALTIPSKVQSYLACGRPVIAAMDGEGANIINKARAGGTCPSGEPATLGSAVLRMYQIPVAERERMGANGREYYMQNFDREMLLDRLCDWMGDLAAGATRRSS